MLLERMFKRLKTMLCHPKYYNEEYGWYNIVNIKFRTDYFKADVLIVTNNGTWYKVPYSWLMDNSVDENGHPVKINNKWV